MTNISIQDNSLATMSYYGRDGREKSGRFFVRKNSNMLIRHFLQYNHTEKESNYWNNFCNYYMLEENNKICLYGGLSAIYTFG